MAMKSNSGRPLRKTPHILNPRDEQILRYFYQYRYMSALDMAYLHFSPASLEHVRAILTSLAGGADLQPNAYLCRFPLPRTGFGNQLKIFALGSKGRKYLQREVGLPVDWYFRPYKYRDLGFSHLRHALILTRLAVAAHYWSRHQSQYTLTQTRLSYELAHSITKVIPDAWLLFEDSNGNKYPVMIEIDRGMEFKDKFTRHVKARIEFIRSGEYSRIFGTHAVIIAYATTGQTPEYRETRQATMCAWIMETLDELEKRGWAGIFRITSIIMDDVYELGLFDKTVWFRPDATSTPMPLLGS
jgi:hypothetical protein